MQATEAKPTRERSALRLNADAFSSLIKAFHGELREYEIGEKLGYNDSEWALIRTGKRYVPSHMVAVCTHELLPGVAVNMYTHCVRYQPRSER